MLIAPDPSGDQSDVFHFALIYGNYSKAFRETEHEETTNFHLLSAA